MKLRLIRILFLFFIFSSFSAVFGQTLYWVGGSGNWNDPQHWSLSSGGRAANIVPGINTDVVFDIQSSDHQSSLVINLVGKNFVGKLSTDGKTSLFITGNSAADLYVSGEFIIDPTKIKFATTLKLHFSSPSRSNHSVLFESTEFGGEIHFEFGNWEIRSIDLGSNNYVYVDGGYCKLKDAVLKTGNFITNSANASLDIDNAFIRIINVLEIGSKTKVSSNKLYLLAPLSVPSKFKVAPNVNFGTNSKFGNNNIAACSSTLLTYSTTCSGVCDGKYVLTLDAGCIPGPLTLNWFAGGGCITPTLTGVTPGTYTMTGFCGCISNMNVLIFDNATNFIGSATGSIMATNSPVNVVTVATQPSCNGMCNGSITATFLNGQPNYTITFTPPGTTLTNVPNGSPRSFTALCQGSKTITMTDVNGCLTTSVVTLNEPPALVHNGTTASLTCNAACTGSAQVSPTGGTPGYTVNWSTGATFAIGAGGTSSQTGLCIGPITATVTDNKACPAIFTTTITQPPALTVTPTQTNATCGGTPNATASVTVLGGTPFPGGSYTYTWSASPSTTNVASGLAGVTNTVTVPNYTVTITDANGCVRTQTFLILEPTPIAIASTQTNVTCFGGCNGIITATASGGNGSYTFALTSSVGTPTTSTGTPSPPPYTGLCAGLPTNGQYTLAVTDNSLCTISTPVTITEPLPITTTVSSSPSVTCFGLCTGTANISVSGGSGIYTYTLTTPTGTIGTAPPWSNLCTGNYTVNVKDNLNCITTPVTFTISTPPAVNPNVTTTSITCSGLCDGIINSSPTGGTGAGYTFTLSFAGGPLAGPAPFTGLCASNNTLAAPGIYTLAVADGNGCTRTQTVNLLQPNSMTVSVVTTSISCFGSCNAQLSGSILGGSPTYTFAWTTPTTSLVGPIIANQCAGTYSLTVTDINGCNVSTVVTVSEPPQITVTINPTQPSCNGDCDGILSSTVTGGTPGYTLSWSAPGGSGPNLSNLCQGNYSLTVTDSRGCIQVGTGTITTPPPIVVTTTAIPTTCAGICTGQGMSNATGGTGTFIYQWSTGQLGANTSPTLCPGNYVINVTDVNGCPGSANITITSPPALTSTITGILPSCNVCIGAATVAASGGNSPAYSYSWTNSAGAVVSTTNTASALCVGNYTVTIIDILGCTSTSTVNIPQTITINITTNGTTLTCNNQCSGIAQANALGGTGTYTYSWSNSTPSVVSTASVATNLCAGTYTVNVVDGLGCSNTSTIAFTNPPGMNVVASQTNAACNATCNAVITVTATGGTGLPTYSWLPFGVTGQGTRTITGLCAGIYTLDVRDANNCLTTTTYTITQPNSITSAFSYTSPTTCSGTNGVITTTVTGGTPFAGTPNYTYNWNPVGVNSASLTNISAGAYSLTVVDAAGCTTTLIAVLSDPTGPTLTVSSGSITCNSACNGSATVTAVGPGPMTYSWTAPVTSTTSIASGICPGTIAVVVTDQSNLCTTSQTLSLSQPTAFTLNPVPANPLCNGGLTGMITTMSGGGSPPYTYTWSPGSSSSPTLTGVGAGVYTLNVMDQNLCPFSQTFTLTSPPAITLTAAATDVQCFSMCNGSITPTPSGGVGGFTYTWSPIVVAPTFPGSNVPTIVNLCPNIYTLTVQDGNLCPASLTVQIVEPPLLTSTLTSQNALCNSDCNGTATFTAGGGVPTYSYSWNGGAPVTTSSLGGLCPGNYAATVIDANGCTSVQSYTITEPGPITVTLTPTNPSCNGGCNGSITTTVSGGSGVYTYSWLPTGSTLQNPINFCPNSYTVFILDNNGCTGQGVTSLVSPPSLLAGVSFTNPSCNSNCNGSAIANPVNGTAPFSYTWTASTTTAVVSSTNTASSLCAGTATVAISDGNGCTATQAFTLTSPPALTINPAISPAVCQATPCNGGITVAPTGGTGPYTYLWTPAISATNVASNVCAGFYTLTVTDANTCANTFTIGVSNSNGPTGATITSTDVACSGACTGAASVTNPVGGTPGYTVTWTATSSTVMPFTNLCTGTYSAQIIDANGCMLFVSIPINSPLPFTDNSVATLPQCNGICNGSITSSPSGGSPPYTFNWSTGSSNVGASSAELGLCTGNYSLSIQDANLCTYTVAFSMPPLTSIVGSTASVNNLCSGGNNGSLLALGLGGGTPPYVYNWSDPLGQTNAQANNLFSGSYYVIITDAAGCFDTLRGTVTEPPPITLTTSVVQPSCGICNGSATVSAQGGTAPFTYTWSNTTIGVSSDSLCAGLYMISIVDGNGCAQNLSVTINNSSTISETVTSTNVSCGICDGTASVTATGGTPPLTYNWISPASTSQSLTGLCNGTYVVQIIDAMNCITTNSAVITPASDFTISPFIIQPGCLLFNGSIIVSVTGNPNDYTYSWAPMASSTASLFGISAGTYSVTVTNTVTGCAKTAVYAVSNQLVPTVSVSGTNATCSGSCNAVATASASGGVSPYTFNWSSGTISGASPTSTANGLCNGVVTVTVSTANGCISIQSVTINQPSPVLTSFPALNTPDCAGDCNGSINLVPSGGTLPYTYSWLPAGSGNPLTNLCAGDYTATITDANGCFTTSISSFSVPPTLGFTANISPASCPTSSNGGITTVVSGGVPVYTYSWTGPGAYSTTGTPVTNLAPGTYSLSLTDFSGCNIDTTLDVTSTVTLSADAGVDSVFCQNGAYTLDGSGSVGATIFQWVQLPGVTVGNSQNVAVTPPAGTNTFVLIVSEGTGCTDSDTMSLTSNIPPFADAGPDYTITVHTSTLIGGSPTGPGGSTFSWTPSFSLDNPTSSNPTASNTVNTTYTVLVTDANGCTASDTMHVHIFPDIIIPNGFSPNADGKNDAWQIDNIEQFPDCVVEVYNRWGELLFNSKGYTTRWDGRFNGKNLPVGTYYYVINLNHENFPKPYTGPITIFR
jgi:large repetitive protein